MKFRLSLAALLILPFSAHAQDNSAVQPETNQVLESSVVLDQSTAVQGNTTLQIERLSTPDEDLIRSLEGNGAADNAASEGGVPDPQLQDKSFFVSAQTFDHTFTLINFWSLRGGIPTQASVWSNITSWKELSSSPSFVSGDTKYTILILPSSAQVTDDSPALPTTLPSIVESGAFFQEVEGQSLSPEYLHFLDDLHDHYQAKKNEILQTHQVRVAEARERAEAEQQEALQNKTVKLRFWRQEDRPVGPEVAPAE